MGAPPATNVEETYQRSMGPLLERARRWFPTLRGSEQDLYQAAWASVLANRDQIRDLDKYLESALYTAGLKELRRRRRRPVISLSSARGRNGQRAESEDGGVDSVPDADALTPAERVERLDEARIAAELLDELPPLQRDIVKLRWGCGLPRGEIASLLGISERTLKRELERAGRAVARSAELARAGRWCDTKRSLVLAYCLGLLSPGRAVKARRHLSHCPGCRAQATELRGRLEHVAAALPFPVLLETHSGHDTLTRAAEAGDAARSALDQVGANVKQHALALLTRAPGGDAAASQVAASGGLRGSGAIVAALTACVVAGGGATYCAVEGVPGAVHDVAGFEQSENPSADTGPSTPAGPKSEPAAAADPMPAPQQSPQSAQPPAQSDTSAQNTPPAATSPAPVGGQEFGSAPAARASRTPAAAPASGGGEFGP
jgi:RNA polymerase sigma factor (sigma-70 family)